MRFDFHSTLTKTGEVGFVERIVSSLLYAEGLPGARMNELVVLESGDAGQVIALRESVVEVLSFSRESVRVGSRLARTGKAVEVPVGEALLGAIIDPLGRSLDPSRLLGNIREYRELEVVPSGIQSRARIRRQFSTGVTIVDLMLPLGYGQRELVIGDQKTGKSRFALRVLRTQVMDGAIGIYVMIGKSKLAIKQTVETLIRMGVKDRTLVVASSSDDAAGMIYLTPYAAMTIAEYFRDKGRNVIIILDDLSTHAKIYREIALLGRRFPGRNSYPGDIFYAHARLLERAGNFILAQGEAAITCLPIVEAPLGDLTGYIQTNTMAMTDGHLFFDHILFAEGRRPAIDPFISVTRVGRQTQSPLGREVGQTITTFLKEVETYHNFASFGAELGEHIKSALAKEEQFVQLFDETSLDSVPPTVQITLFAIIWSGLWRDEKLEKVRQGIQKLILSYDTQAGIKKSIDALVEDSENLEVFLARVKNLDIVRNLYSREEHPRHKAGDEFPPGASPD